jgi:DNA repair exonuclease SbcCD ATPase subunit
MRLKLHNFRCYTDKEFIFSHIGLTLIDGPSGVGKSTVCEAIYYVLYGSLQHTYTYNTTRCWVELEIPFHGSDIKIYRQRGPNRLLINDGQLEDDEAQGYIDSILREHEFLASSYIQQKSVATILGMSPRKQLEFIESLAFDESHVKRSEERILDRIQFYKTMLTKTSSELRIFLTMDKTEPVKDGKPVKDYDKLTSNIEIVHTHITDLEQRLSHQNTVYRNTVSKLEQIQEQKQLRIRKAQLEVKVAEYSKIKRSLKEYRDLITRKRAYIDSQRRLGHQKKLILTIDTMKHDIVSEWVSRIDDLKVSIEPELESSTLESESKALQLHAQNSRLLLEVLDDPTNPDECVKDVLDKCKTLPIILEQLQRTLEELTRAIGDGSIQPCPSCKTPLRVDSGKIIMSQLFNEEKRKQLIVKQAKTRKRVQKIERRLEKLKETKTMIDSLYMGSFFVDHKRIQKVETDLQCIYEVRSRNKERRIQLNTIQERLRKKLWPLSLTRLIGKLDSMGKIESEKDPCDDTLEELVKRETTLSIEVAAIEEDKRELESMSILMDFDDLPDADMLRTEIEDNEAILLTLKEKLKKFQKQSDHHTLYMDYMRQQQEYLDWSGHVTNLKTREGILQRKLSAALLIQKKSLEAQALTIQYTVDHINEMVRFFLGEMFEDDIQVTLETFKLTKTKQFRTQLNIRVMYRGAETSLKALSGGEQDRVSMAFVLAMCEIYNPPILMLDECISSLDSETTNEILHSIERLAVHRPVFVIAHQAIRGAFDHVIDL